MLRLVRGQAAVLATLRQGHHHAFTPVFLLLLEPKASKSTQAGRAAAGRASPKYFVEICAVTMRLADKP